jgi:hypothetical protein
MDDRFEITKYSAISLIIMGLGQIIESFGVHTVGIVIVSFGFIGILTFSGFDKYLISSIIIWTLGIQFIHAHWPYGRLVFVLGGVLAIYALFLRFKKDNFKNYKLWILISLIVLLFTSYFKLQHLHYSTYGLSLGYLSLIVTYSLRFFSKKPKFFEDILKLVLVYLIII